MPFNFRRGFALSTLTMAVVSVACTSHPPLLQKNGVIAQIGGDVQKIAEVDEAQICEVHFCEPNYLYEASFGKKRPKPPTPAPADPGLSKETLDWSRKALDLETVWKTTQGSASVIVAVIDTGVAAGHPDLKNSMVAGYDFIAGSANAADDNGHGTHCAGNIAAEINGVGMVGVAPKVKIMPLKFLDAAGSGDTADAISAIRFAADNGATVISNSWGGGGASQLLDAAIQYARSKGALVVAAAGNNFTNNDQTASYPANYEGVISVAANDETGNLSYFSNYGRNSVMLAAPGSNIFSSILRNTWGNMSGTSMATPIVSGALALGLSLKPNIDRDRIVQNLCDSAQGFSGPTQCGRLDIKAFVAKVLAAP